MDLIPTSEQDQIVSAVGDFLQAQLPLERVRAPMDGADLERTWASLADLGVFGLGVPEDAGGVGLGIAEEVLVFRVFGRALTPGPLVGSVLAAHLAASAGNTDVAEAIVSGRVRVALGEPFRDPQAVADEKVAGRYRILDAPGSALCLMVTSQGAALVDTGQLAITPAQGVDPVVPLGFAQADGLGAMASAAGPTISERGSLLVAALHTGMAEASRDESAEYAKVREQFGKAIGAFQAVKHRCADMAARAEAAFFQTIYAALAWEEGGPTGAFQVSAARVVAAEAARANAADDIVNHGAMGFTLEADPHLFARRAAVYEAALGSSRSHLEAIAAVEKVSW